MTPIISTHSIDAHLGARLKERRKLLKIRQVDLAASMGVSYQQIQKYERGASRLTAVQLCRLAHILQTPISYFFAGLPHASDAPFTEADTLRPDAIRWLRSDEGREFANLMCVAPPAFQTGMLALAQMLAPAAPVAVAA